MQGFTEKKRKKYYSREQGEISALPHFKCQPSVSFYWMSCVRSKIQPHVSGREDNGSIFLQEASRRFKDTTKHFWGNTLLLPDSGGFVSSANVTYLHFPKAEKYVWKFAFWCKEVIRGPVLCGLYIWLVYSIIVVCPLTCVAIILAIYKRPNLNNSLPPKENIILFLHPRVFTEKPNYCDKCLFPCVSMS